MSADTLRLLLPIRHGAGDDEFILGIRPKQTAIRIGAATVPEAPTELTTTKDGERRIDLSWTSPSDDDGANITGYRIEVSADGSAWTDLEADTGVIATRYSHSGLRGETTRHYRVTAINPAGTGLAQS